MSEYKINTDEFEYCKVKVSYEADTEVVEQKRDDIIVGFKNHPVAGFRKGKASKPAIVNQYGKQIKQSLMQQMLSVANDDIIFETKMRTFGNPNIEDVSLDGNLFKCTLSYLKKPEFQLQQYKDFEIPKPHTDKSAEQIAEEMIQNLRNRFAEEVPFSEDDFVQSGDKVTMDVQMSDGNKQEGLVYTVGNNSNKDFDSNLFGMSAGEEREFDIESDGNKVTCKVVVHAGLKLKPCPADDSLATKAGLKDFAAVVEQAKVSAEKYVQQDIEQKILVQVKERLVSSHDFEVPSYLKIMEAQHIAAQQRMDWDSLSPEVKDKLLIQADKNVKLSLIFDSIQNEEPEAELSDQEAYLGIVEFLKSQGVADPYKYIQENTESGKIHGLLAQFRIQHVQGWLLKQVKVVE